MSGVFLLPRAAASISSQKEQHSLTSDKDFASLGRKDMLLTRWLN